MTATDVILRTVQLMTGERGLKTTDFLPPALGNTRMTAILNGEGESGEEGDEGVCMGSWCLVAGMVMTIEEVAMRVEGGGAMEIQEEAGVRGEDHSAITQDVHILTLHTDQNTVIIAMVIVTVETILTVDMDARDQRIPMIVVAPLVTMTMVVMGVAPLKVLRPKKGLDCSSRSASSSGH